MIRITFVIWLIVAGAVAFGLYQMKYEVQRLEEQLSQVRSDIKDDREALHILEAEWSYLNQPARLSKLAKKHLDMEPLEPKQVALVEQLPPRITRPDDDSLAAGEHPTIDDIPLPSRKPWSLRPQLAGGATLASGGTSTESPQ